MKNAVIVHGWGADSQSNWFPWLKAELRKKDFQVSVPNFPNTQYPILHEWLEHFKREIKIDNDTLFIGHSLGVSFILRLLEQVKENTLIKASFLVAGFERPLGIGEIKNFVDKPFIWNKIKKSCTKFVVINSDNDEYIPLSIGKDLAQNLNTELIVEHNKGHLDNPTGFFSYPKLLEEVQKV